MVPTARCDKRAVSGQGDTRREALDPGPHSFLSHSRNLSGKLQPPRVTFSKRKLWQTQHCFSQCITMRVEPEYICFESRSPSYIDKHQQLSALLCRGIQQEVPTSLSFDENLDLCPVPGCVTEGFAILLHSAPEWRAITAAHVIACANLSTCPLHSWKGCSQG